jgi:hypothetical protein
MLQPVMITVQASVTLILIFLNHQFSEMLRLCGAVQPDTRAASGVDSKQLGVLQKINPKVF